MLIFLAGVMPKEYLHDALFNHHDTVDPVLKKGEVVISNKHTHCSFVGFAFGPFISTEKQLLCFEHSLKHVSYPVLYYCSSYSSIHHTVSLRGPPELGYLL
ncbi:MAG: hypothetical protein JWQ38_1953 [Flavipsychrobacter sp.]|nr:hypothetical protein [Flavipsychrobacter sp.]